MSRFLLVPIRNRQGQTVATVMIDPDQEHLLAHRWHLVGRGYAARTVGNSTEYLHRRVMGLTSEDAALVDHRDGNRLDCRKQNLRLATQSENQSNRTGARSGARGDATYPRGVVLDKRRGVYYARTTLNGRTRHLGTFSTVEAAAKAAKVFRARAMPFSPDARRWRRARRRVRADG